MIKETMISNEASCNGAMCAYVKEYTKEYKDKVLGIFSGPPTASEKLGASLRLFRIYV